MLQLDVGAQVLNNKPLKNIFVSNLGVNKDSDVERIKEYLKPGLLGNVTEQTLLSSKELVVPAGTVKGELVSGRSANS